MPTHEHLSAARRNDTCITKKLLIFFQIFYTHELICCCVSVAGYQMLCLWIQDTQHTAAVNSHCYMCTRETILVLWICMFSDFFVLYTNYMCGHIRYMFNNIRICTSSQINRFINRVKCLILYMCTVYGRT